MRWSQELIGPKWYISKYTQHLLGQLCIPVQYGWMHPRCVIVGFAELSPTLYSSVSHTYISHLICHWPSAPVEWGCHQTQALVMNGLRSLLNWGRIEAQTIYFSVPCQMGAAVPPDPPSGSSRSFPGDCTYYYIYILCYIFGGAAAPRNSWAGVGILMAISYIFYFSLLPLGALSNSLRVSRSLLARRAALCQHSMDPKRLSYTVILFGGPFQSILFSVAFIQEFPWRCARCALPKSEYLVCSNLCPWRGAQRSKCHYIIWPCFVVKIWH